MSLTKRIVIGALCVLLVIPLAYLFENYDRENGLHTGKVIKVQDQSSGKVLSLMGVDMMKTLMNQEFPGDAAAKGPTLGYVIGASGLTGFRDVEIKGLKRNETCRLSKDELNESLVLAFTGRGTVDLIRRNEPDRPLIHDVSEINKVD